MSSFNDWFLFGTGTELWYPDSYYDAFLIKLQRWKKSAGYIIRNDDIIEEEVFVDNLIMSNKVLCDMSEDTLLIPRYIKSVNYSSQGSHSGQCIYMYI